MCDSSIQPQVPSPCFNIQAIDPLETLGKLNTMYSIVSQLLYRNNITTIAIVSQQYFELSQYYRNIVIISSIVTTSKYRIIGSLGTQCNRPLKSLEGRGLHALQQFDGKNLYIPKNCNVSFPCNQMKARVTVCSSGKKNTSISITLMLKVRPDQRLLYQAYPPAPLSSLKNDFLVARKSVWPGREQEDQLCKYIYIRCSTTTLSTSGVI